MKVYKSAFIACLLQLTLRVCATDEQKMTPADGEDIMKQLADKLDSIKGSTKEFTLDPEAEAIFEDYDIHIEALGDRKREEKTKIVPPSLDAPPSQWPGHGKPFGSVGGLANQVEKMESVIRPTTFINRYAAKGHPVLFQGLLSDSPALKMWDVTYLSNAPPSAMSKISVYDSAVEHLTKSSLSVRDFIKSKNSDLFMFDQTPSFLMKDLAFPRILKCEKLLQNLKKHLMSYYKRSIVTEPVIMSDDRLVCSLIGQPTYILVPADSWESSAQNETNIDFSAVDYNTHPWLREIKYYQALQTLPGDCIYVPRQWYVQSSHPDTPSSSVVFTWKELTDKVSKHTCGQQDVKTEEAVSAYLNRFTTAMEQRDANKDALIHYFAFYLGEQLASSFTLKQFLRKLKRDDKLFTKLENWTTDVNDISTELFELLDVNADKKFSLNDLVDLDSEARDVLVSQIQDRLHDFAAVMEEQRKMKLKHQAAEKKASPPPTPASKTKKSVPPKEDIADEFKEELQKEVAKMIKEMEETERAQEKATAGNTAEKEPPTREEIKSKAKASAQKKKEAETKQKSAKPRRKERYRVVDDEEIEIVAEEDEIDDKKSKKINAKSGSKQQTTQNSSSQSNSSKAKSSKAHKENKVKQTKQQSKEKTVKKEEL